MATYLFRCRKCGHEITASFQPSPLIWTDGHKCVFYRVDDESENRAEINDKARETLRRQIEEQRLIWARKEAKRRAEFPR